MAKLLKIDEERAKKLILSCPALATTKIEFAENSFYNMKDFLNVNDNKMIELALISPCLIQRNFVKNKNYYQDIADKIGVSITKFIEAANNCPRIYQVSFNTLEKTLAFISQKFNFSRPEALIYLRKNLPILSVGL